LTNRERIPLQKLEINVKTTNTTKRCSNRTVDSNISKKGLKNVLKRKPQNGIKRDKKAIKALITRSKSRVVTKIGVLSAKKLIKKSANHPSNRNSTQMRAKVALVVDLPNGSLRCDKHLRTTTNGSKKIK